MADSALSLEKLAQDVCHLVRIVAGTVEDSVSVLAYLNILMEASLQQEGIELSHAERLLLRDLKDIVQEWDQERKKEAGGEDELPPEDFLSDAMACMEKTRILNHACWNLLALLIHHKLEKSVKKIPPEGDLLKTYFEECLWEKSSHEES